jgi:hypothetical protein
LFWLSAVPPLSARLTANRCVGIDVYCNDTTDQATYHLIASFDLKRRALLYGDPTMTDELARAGFVMTVTGALAWIDDSPGSTQVNAWDAQGKRTLDSSPRRSDISGLVASGTTVSWLNGGQHRSAVLR